MVVTKETEPYELQYIKILRNILSDGSRELNERTGVETLRIPHSVITVDLLTEFPILKSKQVLWKTAAKEILWIMQKQSNNINDLDAHIWDAWADENGSIGKAYGYQVAKRVVADGVEYPSQVHYVLDRLRSNPSDRRAKIDLWNVDDLGEMRLVPCCYSSLWTITKGRLNCMLVQRSADFLVGVPFNTTQYAILTYLFAKHLGVEVGQLTHVMSDCHVYCYASHLEGADKMIHNFELFDDIYNLNESMLNRLKETSAEIRRYAEIAEAMPYLNFTSDSNDFFSVNIEDIHLEDYHYMEKLYFDVAK